MSVSIEAEGCGFLRGGQGAGAGAEFEIPCKTMSEMVKTFAVYNCVCSFLLTYLGYLNIIFVLILVNLSTI